MTAGNDISRSPEGTPLGSSEQRGTWAEYLSAVLVTAATTAVGWPLHHHLGLTNTDVLMLYLLGVVWAATRYGRGAAILASVLGVAAFDFFFVPPYFTLVVSHRQYVVTFIVMLIAALVISTLTHRVRTQAAAAHERARRTQMLLALNRELAAARTTEEIVATTIRHAAEAVGTRAVLLLVDADGRLLLTGDAGATRPPDSGEHLVAQWAVQHGQVAGAGAESHPAAAGTYFPLKASRGAVGVLGVFPDPKRERRSDQWQLLEGFASQAALAVERASLGAEARAAWERVETEFLRNTLLSGISHDLRTPLTAITGAASTLIETGDRLAPGARAEMLDTIYSEAERMERLIGNLLDMTRLEAGGLALRKEWQPLQEVVGSALHHLDRRLRGRVVKTHLPADLPLIQIDAVAVEQVLVNLLENAVDHTPKTACIEVSASAVDGEIVVEVADDGAGLPPGTESRVFEKFFRAVPAESRNGIGLGLAISRGIVEAHGGTIIAANRPIGGGAVFRFTLPRTSTPPSVDASD